MKIVVKWLIKARGGLEHAWVGLLGLCSLSYSLDRQANGPLLCLQAAAELCGPVHISVPGPGDLPIDCMELPWPGAAKTK